MVDEDDVSEEEVEEEVEEEEEDLEDMKFSDFFETDDDEEDEDEDAPKDEQEEQQEGVPEESRIPHLEFNQDRGVFVDPESGEEFLPQSKINEIMGSARIKGRELEESARAIQERTGLTLSQLEEELRRKEAEDLAEETGLPPEEASRIVEDRVARQYLEKNLLSLAQRQQQQHQMLQYGHEKEPWLKNPIIKQYEKEIDAVSQGGQRLGWVAAMNFVLGDKVARGELAQNMQATQQRRAPQAQRSQMSPELGGGAGYTPPVIPKELRFFAQKMGVDPKEAYKEMKAIEKEKKRGF